MQSMKALHEARRKNLIELIDRLGGRGAIVTIANRLGYSWPGFVSQMKSQPGKYGHRAMTEATARAIEAAFSLPVGAMDTYPLPPEGTARAEQSPTTNRLIVLLADAADRAGVHLPPDKLASAVMAMEAAGRNDSAYADIVVSLMR